LVVIVELLCDGTVSPYHGITVCARHPLVDELDREFVRFVGGARRVTHRQLIKVRREDDEIDSYTTTWDLTRRSPFPSGRLQGTNKATDGECGIAGASGDGPAFQLPSV